MLIARIISERSNHSHKIVAALLLPSPATATITCPKRNSVVTADTKALNLNQAQQIDVQRSLQLLTIFINTFSKMFTYSEDYSVQLSAGTNFAKITTDYIF